MMTCNLGLRSAPCPEHPQKSHMIADCTVGPMPLQATDVHGYQMYPQKLVRLVGCHAFIAAAHKVGQNRAATSDDRAVVE